MKKLVFLCILFLGITSVSFGQSEKLEKKAKALTEKLNSEIIAGDEALALTAEQKIEIEKIQLERILDLKKLGKDATKEEKKAMNKKHFQKIYKEVLTKDQLKARKKGKQKKEEE